MNPLFQIYLTMPLYSCRSSRSRPHHLVPVDLIKNGPDTPDPLEPLQDHPRDPRDLRIRPKASLVAGNHPRWAPTTSLCRLGFPRGEPIAGEMKTLRHRSCSNRAARNRSYRFGFPGGWRPGPACQPFKSGLPHAAGRFGPAGAGSAQLCQIRPA
jgi:hypothetical protein